MVILSVAFDFMSMAFDGSLFDQQTWAEFLFSAAGICCGYYIANMSDTMRIIVRALCRFNIHTKHSHMKRKRQTDMGKNT